MLRLTSIVLKRFYILYTMCMYGVSHLGHICAERSRHTIHARHQASLDTDWLRRAAATFVFDTPKRQLTHHVILFCACNKTHPTSSAAGARETLPLVCCWGVPAAAVGDSGGAGDPSKFILVELIWVCAWLPADSASTAARVHQKLDL